MTEHRVPVGGGNRVGAGLGLGVGLHVEIDGTGGADATTLLLVNGAFCTTRVWDNAIADLARSFRVIRHDVRGTGRSDPGPSEEYRFERYADDIAELFDHFEIARGLVWGMAWGARVALVTAARHPQLVERLLLSDLAIDPADPEAQRAGAKAAAAARAEHGIVDAPKPNDWNTHLDPDEATKAMAATRHHPDLMPFVTQVQAPTLIATGDHDPNLVSSRRALPGFAGGELTVIPHTGHGFVRQRPDLVPELILPFLTS